MKRRLGLLRAYSLLSTSLLAVIAGFILELLGQHKTAHWLLALVSLGLLAPLLWEMWQDLRSGRYGIDILAATAVVAAVILGQYWAGMIIILILASRRGQPIQTNR
jgi:cation transport ATPase